MKKTSTNKKTTAKNPWELTIGSDFELFIQDTTTGQFVSSLDILDGKDKYNPFVVDEHTKFFCDNVLFEGNVKYALTKEELVNNFRFTLTKMAECLHQLYGDKYNLIADAAHEFDNETLNHPLAREAGCSVSYNAHTMAVSEAAPFSEVNTRTSALHFHFGRTDFDLIKKSRGEILLDTKSRNDIVLLSDLFLGNTMNIIDGDRDNSILRRKYYGKAGELRIPKFGLEYRVLHSYFLRHPSMIETVYDIIEYMFEIVRNKQENKILESFNLETVRNAIDNCSQEVSRAIFEALKLPDNIVKQVRNHENNRYDSDVLKMWNIKIPATQEITIAA